MKARQQEVATAEQLLKNNQDQVRIGTLAEIEVTRAQSQLYTARQDLVISQTNLLQQETVLKNALSRSGVGTSDLADVHVIPLDTFTIPAKEEAAADQRSGRGCGEEPGGDSAGAHQPRKQQHGSRRHQEFPEAHAAGFRRTDQQRTSSGLGNVPGFSGGYGTLLARDFPPRIIRTTRPASR